MQKIAHKGTKRKLLQTIDHIKIPKQYNKQIRDHTENQPKPISIGDSPDTRKLFYTFFPKARRLLFCTSSSCLMCF